MKLLYGGFATQEELDREYDAENSVPDFVTAHLPHACSSGLHNSFSGQCGP